MGESNILPVKNIGQLMDQLKGGETRHINIPRLAGSGSLCQRLHDDIADQPAKTPSELSDFDGLMRRCNRYYGERLSDSILLRAIDAVAEHKGCLVHDVRRMTFGEFNATLDEAMARGEGKWSKHYSPKQLAKLFGMSWDALKKQLDSGEIQNIKHTTKDYQIDMDHMPPVKP